MAANIKGYYSNKYACISLVCNNNQLKIQWCICRGIIWDHFLTRVCICCDFFTFYTSLMFLLCFVLDLKLWEVDYSIIINIHFSLFRYHQRAFQGFQFKKNPPSPKITLTSYKLLLLLKDGPLLNTFRRLWMWHFQNKNLFLVIK